MAIMLLLLLLLLLQAHRHQAVPSQHAGHGRQLLLLRAGHVQGATVRKGNHGIRLHTGCICV
jgi:hypothetical protein